MRRGFLKRKKRPAKRRNVESEPKKRVRKGRSVSGDHVRGSAGETTDAHERGKNFLNDAEREKMRDDAKRRQLSDACGGGERRFEERAPAHAAALVRVLPREHRCRLAHDAGLPWTSRSQAHRSLHACRRPAIRGVVEVMFDLRGAID